MTGGNSKMRNYITTTTSTTTTTGEH